MILGILQRSGTNYLMDLLELHPDCRGLPVIGEDFLVANARHLEEFSMAVARSWNAEWDPQGDLRKELREHLGAACISFLAGHARKDSQASSRYVVSKTPSVAGLELLCVFPGVKAIVLVRDGRAVIASGMKSFGWTFEKVCRRWATAGRAIMAAKEQGMPFLLVRYEDLVRDMGKEMNRIFEYLDLAPGSYDFERAANLPVRGSSSFGTADGKVHWQRVERTADFKPMGRGDGWSEERNQRFNWLAGAVSAYFGYEGAGPPTANLRWRFWNRLLDFNFIARRRLNELLGRRANVTAD